MEKQLLDLVCKDYQEKFNKTLIVHKTRSVGGGCISHTLCLTTNEGDFFLKWNQHVATDLFLKEAEGLNEMATVSNEFLIVPEVFLCKEVNETPGYILMEFLPIGSSDNQDVNFGRGLALLHNRTADQYGFYHDNYCGATRQINEWCPDWLAFFGEKRILHLMEEILKTRSFSSTDIDTLNELIYKLPELIGINHIPALIHGDLWSGNYLYTQEGPAIIDPATYYGVPEMELSIMTMFGGFSEKTWNAYLEMSQLDSGWQGRVQIYQIYHMLNHYYLFGGSYGNQAISVAKKFL